jgi:hypothetical protein
MNENYLVHSPSCSATNIVPNLFVRFCQRLERFERLEPRELFGRWGKNWQRRKKGGPKSLNLEHGTLNLRVRDETGLIFQLRKAKEKSSGALRKIRKPGTTVEISQNSGPTLALRPSRCFDRLCKLRGKLVSGT